MNKDDLLHKLKELSPRRKEILSELLQGKSDAEIREEFKISLATVRKHVQEVCEYFGIQSKLGRRRNRRKELRQLFTQHGIVTESPSNILTSTATVETANPQEPAEDSLGTQNQITYLSGVVPLDSPLYVRRESVDDFCKQQLRVVTPGAESLPLIKVKGAKSMGKSSLLVRLRDFAEEEIKKEEKIKEKEENRGHVVALVDIGSDFLDPKVFNNLGYFLHEFTKVIVRGLKNSKNLPKETKDQIEKKTEALESDWERERELTAGLKCTNYLEEIFKEIKQPKTLLIDGIDAFPNEAADTVEIPFLNLLRYWHETKMKIVVRNTTIFWPSIVIAYSTLRYGRPSPLLNVGISVELPEFDQNQVSNLAKKYGLDWDPIDYNLISLMNLVGGHPMLANWALYRVSQDHISLDELKRQVIESDNPNDPIVDFLHESLRAIKQSNDVSLLECLKKVEDCDSESAKEQLERAGLIKLKGSKWHISCELYSKYFYKHLQ